MKYVCINTRLFPAQCFVPDVCACLRRSGTLAFLCCLLLEHGNCQEYQCASSQFNESHLWHICTFIPLQGEIPLPKQSLRRVKGCGSAVLQILIVYPRWLQINSINPFRTCWLLKAFCIYDFCNIYMLQVSSIALRGKNTGEGLRLECQSELPRSRNLLARERDFTNMSTSND